MELTKKILIGYILEFYSNELVWTQEKIADHIQTDGKPITKATVNNWINQKATISPRMFRSVLDFLENDIENNGRNDQFFVYFFKTIEKNGFDKDKCKRILNSKEKMSEKITNLLDVYNGEIKWPLERISHRTIIGKLEEFCKQFRKSFITLPKTHIKDTAAFEKYDCMLIEYHAGYRMVVVLSNDKITSDNFVKLCDDFKSFMNKNNISMMLIFTDFDVSIDHLKFFVENYNVFYETIPDTVDSYKNVKYAQQFVDEYINTIIKRFSSYLTVSKNNIVFQKYNDSVLASDKLSRDPVKDFCEKVLPKDIFGYSYIDRHAIYFEREQLRDSALRLLKAKKKKKLNMVVEWCSTNAMISYSVFDIVDKVILFSSSNQAINITKEHVKKGWDSKGSQVANVQLNLSHINPQYASEVYKTDIVGKADLVILGFGMGSTIVDIVEFLRSANKWLAPDGKILISFINSESVINYRQNTLNSSIGTKPVYTSEYVEYSLGKTLSLPIRQKSVSLEEAEGLVSPYTKTDLFCTYPFLSALINENQRDEDWLKEEIRNIDKIYALGLCVDKEYAKGSNKGLKSKKGHYLMIVGTKRETIHNQQNEIYIFLDEKKIHYKRITHASAIDSRDLYKALLQAGEKSDEFSIVKTILINKRVKDVTKRNLKYIICPIDFMIDQKKYRQQKLWLLSEKRIVEFFGNGNVSPLSIIPSIVKPDRLSGSYYQQSLNTIKEMYIIFSAGINTESIKIKTTDFIALLSELNVSELNEKELLS